MHYSSVSQPFCLQVPIKGKFPSYCPGQKFLQWYWFSTARYVLIQGSQTQSVSRAVWDWKQGLACRIKKWRNFFWVNIQCFWENRPIGPIFLLNSLFFLMFAGRIGPSRGPHWTLSRAALDPLAGRIGPSRGPHWTLSRAACLRPLLLRHQINIGLA